MFHEWHEKLIHFHPLKLLLFAVVRIKTDEGHDAEVMDVSDLADLQRRVIIWLLGIVVTLVVLSATGTAFWLNEHFDQKTLENKLSTIDTAGTQYGARVLEQLNSQRYDERMRDTLVVVHLNELLEGQRMVIRRLDRLERLLKLPPVSTDGGGNQ